MATILVVDDNASNLDIIESIFAHEDLDLFYASSGIHALELLEALAIDTILLDVMMPEMDGIEVCRRIKANPKWSCIPVVMVTSLDSKEDLAFCLQTGADDFVKKPVNALELRARVRSMLRIKEQYDNLQTLLQARTDVTNTIMRELRNPLTTMMLASGVLQRTPLSETQQKKVDQIYISGKQAIASLDSQLIISKIERGSLSLDCIDLNLVTMIQMVVVEFQVVIENYGLELVTEFPQKSQLTKIDESLLRQIIEHLITNAINSSNTGQKITIHLEYPPEIQARISVIDEGWRLRDEAKDIILNRFEMNDLFANIQNTGLGLAFCKLATEAQGGKFWVTDNQPQGSIFTVEI
jgi:two-component system sensor histidine kinase/response regulator